MPAPADREDRLNPRRRQDRCDRNPRRRSRAAGPRPWRRGSCRFDVVSWLPVPQVGAQVGRHHREIGRGAGWKPSLRSGHSSAPCKATAPDHDEPESSASAHQCRVGLQPPALVPTGCVQSPSSAGDAGRGGASSASAIRLDRATSEAARHRRAASPSRAALHSASRPAGRRRARRPNPRAPPHGGTEALAEVVRSPDPAPRPRDEGRRAPSRDLGRGARPDRRGVPRGRGPAGPGRDRRRSGSSAAARRPTRSTSRPRSSRGRSWAATTSTAATAPDTPRLSPVWRPSSALVAEPAHIVRSRRRT